MKKLRHTFSLGLTDGEIQMYQRLLTHFPLGMFPEDKKLQIQGSAEILPTLESYRGERWAS